MRILRSTALVLSLGASACSTLPANAGGTCDMSTAQVFDRVGESVVSISATSINPYSTTDRVSRDTGSGIVIDRARRLVLTNAHVVLGAQYVTVTVRDSDTVHADVVGLDPVFDLAVLRLDDSPGLDLKAATLGQSSAVRVGQDVIAVGNPLGLTRSLSTGVVSAVDRVLPVAPFAMSQPYIQTDAAINPGNSGGPLLDRCGHVIGINTAVIEGAQNIGFAIPSDLAREVIPRLVRDGRIVRPWLGFQGQFVDEDLAGILRIPMTTGLLVEAVEPGGPAEARGLQGGRMEITIDGDSILVGGDIITHINGHRIDSIGALTQSLRPLTVGDRVTLQIFRRGERTSVSYELPERPLLPSDLAGQVELPVGSAADSGQALH